MLVTNHVLSGAVLGALLPGPGSALVAGFASHFVLDAIPHWGDIDLDEVLHIAVADGLVGLAAMGVLAGRATRVRRLAVVAGMVGASLPDLDKPSELFFGRSPFPRRFDDFHGGIQRESQRRMPQEIVVGVALAAVALRVVGRRAAAW